MFEIAGDIREHISELCDEDLGSAVGTFLQEMMGASWTHEDGNPYIEQFVVELNEELERWLAEQGGEDA
jgi:hypothetical protein